MKTEDKKFEIMMQDREDIKFTVAIDRITLKLPASFDPVKVGYFTHFIMKAAHELEGEPLTYRGNFKKTDTDYQSIVMGTGHRSKNNKKIICAN